MLPLLLATTLNPLNSAMLATALVPIGRAFPGQEEISAWLVASLYLTAGVAQPVLGSFADRFGPRRTLLYSLAVLAVGALVGSIAGDMLTLIGSRVLIGLGTSGAFPCAVAIIRHRAAEAGLDPPARLLGVLAAASAVSVAIGPPLGGLVTQWLGWRGVFSINLPLAILTLICLFIMVPSDEEKDGEGRSVDWVGIGLFTVFMTALVFFLMHLTKRFDILALGISLAGLTALISFEARRERPFLDVKLLRTNRLLTITYLNHLLFSFANYCVFYSVPQWSQAWLRLPLAVSGFVLMPIAISSTIASLAPTRGRLGYIVEFIGIGSLILTCAGLLLLNKDTTLIEVMAITFLFGTGYGALNMSNQQRLLDYAPLEHSGSAAGLLRTAQYCGAILSAPLVGYLIAGHLGAQPMRTLAWIILPISFVPMTVWISDIRRGRRQGDI
jgi:MFS family permease